MYRADGDRYHPRVFRRGSRLERKLFQLGDELARLAEEERLVAEELTYHRHLADDAARDAAVSGAPLDRREAGLVAADVARFERRLAELQRRRRSLEERRRELLRRLGD